MAEVKRKRGREGGKIVSFSKPLPDMLSIVHYFFALSKEKQHSKRCRIVQSSTA